MPGRTDCWAITGDAQRLSGKELEDLARADGLAHRLGQGLALLPCRKAADLLLARQQFGADGIKQVMPGLRTSGPRRQNAR
jgi:hypothetical protein